jgi:hypothetical protein
MFEKFIFAFQINELISHLGTDRNYQFVVYIYTT